MKRLEKSGDSCLTTTTCTLQPQFKPMCMGWFNAGIIFQMKTVLLALMLPGLKSEVMSFTKDASSGLLFVITLIVCASTKDLVAATPKINGYFAATTRPVLSGGVTAKVYAAAQCVETISQKDCHSCLTIGYNNLQSCPPGAEGSSADAGCFLRYSDASFFAENSTIRITPNLQRGNSNLKTTIIGGVVGVICLLLILSVLLWYQSVRKANVAQRGDMLGLSKLQGPVIYSFKDLKSATRNFSEDSKIGEGGYGDVICPSNSYIKVN